MAERHERLGARIVAAVGEAGARDLLDCLTRSDADRAALIGRLSRRADAEWLAELLSISRRTNRRGCGWWRRCRRCIDDPLRSDLRG